MYITNVSGHHSATLAIENAINELDPEKRIANINGFQYVNPVMEKVIHTLYLWVIKRAPFIWEYLYDNPKVIAKSARIKQNVNKKNVAKVQHLIEGSGCKVAVCSQAFPCGLIAEYKRSFATDVKLIAVITDFVAHSYWVYDEVDFYIVASQQAKEALTSKGVAPEKVKIFGIPIDPLFAKVLDKQEIAKKHNISLDKPIILAMGGGHGLGPIQKLISAFDNSSIDAHMIVVAGINWRLHRWMQRQKYKKNITCFGYVDFIDELMSLADILITKPGGITTAEALAKNLPMIIIKPLPGQEQNNTNFLLEKGAVEKGSTVEQALATARMLLSNEAQADSLRKNSASLARPDSALRIAELTISLC